MHELDSLDVGVMGEGEYTLLDLVKKINNNENLSMVNGIMHRQGGKVVKNQQRRFIDNLDELPFPERNLLNLGKVSYRSNLFRSAGGLFPW